MFTELMLWLFLGICIGQIADRYLQGGRWHGFYGDLVASIAGSLTGGRVWIYYSRHIGLFGALLYAAIGALSLILLIRLFGLRRNH